MARIKKWKPRKIRFSALLRYFEGNYKENDE